MSRPHTPLATQRSSDAARRGVFGSQRGEGRLKVIIWLVIFLSMIYTGVKVIPILYGEYVFQDAMQTTARYASVNHLTPDQIRASLVQEAAKDDLPVKPTDIVAANDSGNVKVSADFTVVVDLMVYQLTLNFHPNATNAAL